MFVLVTAIFGKITGIKLLSDTPVFTAKPGIIAPEIQAENTADPDALLKVIDQQVDVIEKKSCVIAEQKKHIALLEEHLCLERARIYVGHIG